MGRRTEGLGFSETQVVPVLVILFRNRDVVPSRPQSEIESLVGQGGMSLRTGSHGAQTPLPPGMKVRNFIVTPFLSNNPTGLSACVGLGGIISVCN